MYTRFFPRDTYVETHDGGNCVGRVVFADDRRYKREGEAQNKISKDRWLLYQFAPLLSSTDFSVAFKYYTYLQLVLFRNVVARLLRNNTFCASVILLETVRVTHLLFAEESRTEKKQMEEKIKRDN